MAVTKEETEQAMNTIIEIHNDIMLATEQKTHVLHRRLPTGGEPGVRDSAGLYVLAYKILSFREKNPNRPIGDVATEVLYDLARNHYFWDGNKRTAYVMTKMTMFPPLKPDYEDALDFIIKVADKKVNKSQVRKWLIENSASE